VAGLDHRIRPLAQGREADMAGRRLQAARVQLGLGARGIIELGPDALDVPISCLRHRIQDAVEIAERAHRVKLDREHVRDAHGAYPLRLDHEPVVLLARKS
jgi:hypothetical protein